VSYHNRVRADPVCGHCGYCVRGISALTCPECGSDLREVGILAPNMRVPMSRLVRVLVLIVAFPLPAFLVSWLLLSTVLPFSVRHKEDREIVCQAPYLNITLDTFAEEYPWQPGMLGRFPFKTVHVELDDRAVTGFLEADLSNGSYHYWSMRGPTVSRPTGFNGATIANWLALQGVNVNDPRVLVLCNQIYQALGQMQQGTASQRMTLLDANGKQAGFAKPLVSWVVYDEPNPLMIAALSLFWLVVLTYTIRRIYRPRTLTAAP
jgi:hypothetical protein